MSGYTATLMIQVLLSTFNGARYLQPLLDSVLAQDVGGLSVLVRDDGSADETVALLDACAATHPGVRVLRGENIGFARSFMRLLEASSSAAQYIAFCDQDDVWQPGKLARAVNGLSHCPPEVPALYCSRLTVVDERLNPLGRSPIPKKELSFRNALVENRLAGCTMLMNQAARRILLRAIPENLVAHDWWTYLIVSAFGTVRFDRESRVLYRQHTSNVIGIRLGSVRRLHFKIRRYWRIGAAQPVVGQAEELNRLYGGSLSDEHRRILGRFLRSSRQRFWGRCRYACFCEVYRQSVFDNLVLKALISLKRL